MGAITIRRLEDAVLDRLKEKAKAAGRSMEEEARRQLIDSNPPPRRMFTPEEALEELGRLRAAQGERVFPDPASEIRRLRDSGYPRGSDKPE